jgi:hypothetical protein
MALRSSTPDFLFENENRSFPFEYSKELERLFPFSNVLDLKIFSRSLVNGKVQFVGVSRWNSNAPKPSVPQTISGLLKQSTIQLFFRIPSLTSDIYVALDAVEDVDSPSEVWPVACRSTVTNSIGTPYIVISGIIGGSIFSSIPSNSYIALPSVYVEPSIVVEAYKKSVDQLKIIHANGAEELIRGKLVFTNGINSSVSMSGNTTRFTARVKDGEGAGQDNTGINLLCEGILSINGTQPTADGQFYIVGGRGVSVVDIPSQHKIKITTQKDSPLSVCEDVEIP